MKEFLDEALTLKWWLGVFFVGIIINLASEALGNFIRSSRKKYVTDKQAKKVAKHWRRLQKIAYLTKHPHSRTMLFLHAIKKLVYSVLLTSLTIFFTTTFHPRYFGQFAFYIFFIASSAVGIAIGIFRSVKEMIKLLAASDQTPITEADWDEISEKSESTT